MKNFLFTSVLGLFLTAALPAIGQEQAPAPTHKDGQSWQFKVTETFKGISSSNALDGIYEVRVAGDTVTVSQSTDGKMEPVKGGRSGVLRALLGKTDSEEGQDFKFPLSAGQKWSYNYQHTAIGAKKPVQRSVEINETGPEQITTPAGTFKAFKIKKEDRPGKGNVWVTTHYWSPETNSVVKSSWDSTDGGGVGSIREVELVSISAK
jgi:hypothetical protein